MHLDPNTGLPVEDVAEPGPALPTTQDLYNGTLNFEQLNGWLTREINRAQGDECQSDFDRAMTAIELVCQKAGKVELGNSIVLLHAFDTRGQSGVILGLLLQRAINEGMIDLVQLPVEDPQKGWPP